MRRFLLGPAGLFIGFLWGFAEATLFFIIPDVFLTLPALFSIRQSLKVMAAILLGSVLGGGLMFWYGEAHPAQAESLVMQVPFVTQKTLAKTQEEFERYGIWALVKGPAGGIPYKIYAVQSPRYAGLVASLLVTVMARAWRFVLSWAVAVLLGAVFKKGIERRPWAAVAAHLCVWTAIYAWYWTKVSHG